MYLLRSDFGGVKVSDYCDTVVQILIVKCKKIDSVFVTVYRPPSTNYIQWKNAIQYIENSIEMVQSNGNYNNIIIQGDFNFKNLIWNNGLIDFEIGMCGQAELLASLMRNR